MGDRIGFTWLDPLRFYLEHQEWSTVVCSRIAVLTVQAFSG